MCGEVRDVLGRLLAPGDRIVWSVAVSCGRCFFCSADLPQKCDSLRKYGHEKLGERGPFGGLATHCHLLPGTAIVRAPDGVPDEVLAPASCATATVMNVLSNASRDTKSVAVVGLGMLGLTACAALRAIPNVETVIACDSSDSRLSLAGGFGATHAARPDSLLERARQLTHGRGVDLALELSGSPAAAALSLDVLRTGGTAVWAGAVRPTEAVPVHPETIVRKCLSLHGVHNYAPLHLQQAVEFLAAHGERFPFAQLVERCISLEDVNEAFAFAEKERPIRVAVGNDTALRIA
jgi:alcohol dehydrogenase